MENSCSILEICQSSFKWLQLDSNREPPKLSVPLSREPLRLSVRLRTKWFGACFDEGVAWHSGNYRVWIHSDTRTWHGKNIQSNLRIMFHFSIQCLLIFNHSIIFESCGTMAITALGREHFGIYLWHLKHLVMKLRQLIDIVMGSMEQGTKLLLWTGF